MALLGVSKSTQWKQVYAIGCVRRFLDSNIRSWGLMEPLVCTEEEWKGFLNRAKREEPLIHPAGMGERASPLRSFSLLGVCIAAPGMEHMVVQYLKSEAVSLRTLCHSASSELAMRRSSKYTPTRPIGVHLAKTSQLVILARMKRQLQANQHQSHSTKNN